MKNSDIAVTFAVLIFFLGLFMYFVITTKVKDPNEVHSFYTIEDLSEIPIGIVGDFIKIYDSKEQLIFINVNTITSIEEIDNYKIKISIRETNSYGQDTNYYIVNGTPDKVLNTIKRSR